MAAQPCALCIMPCADRTTQAKRFHERKFIPAQNAIFVLHEVIRDTTITDDNTEVITKAFSTWA